MRTTSSPSSQTMPMLVLLASLLLPAATAASNNSCAPERYCGNLTISYPFSLAGAQPLYCGYTPLDLDCDASRAYLRNTFRERLFRVDDISYANNSMVAAIAGDGHRCPVPDFNVSDSLTLFPFAISGTNRRLVLFHGCTVPPGLRLPRPCGNGTIGAYISGRWEDGEAGGTLPRGVSRNCTSVSVPVRGGMEQGLPLYERLISDGFLLELPQPLGDCDGCRRMRGECRLVQQSFQCVCPDGRFCPTPNATQLNSTGHPGVLS